MDIKQSVDAVTDFLYFDVWYPAKRWWQTRVLCKTLGHKWAPFIVERTTGCCGIDCKEHAEENLAPRVLEEVNLGDVCSRCYAPKEPSEW